MSRASSLRDLVSRKYLHLRRHPLLSGEGIRARDVLFLFNGLEKMKLDFRIGSSELCSDPAEPLPPAVLVVNLLRKYLLPEVSAHSQHVLYYCALFLGKVWNISLGHLQYFQVCSFKKIRELCNLYHRNKSSVRDRM